MRPEPYRKLRAERAAILAKMMRNDAGVAADKLSLHWKPDPIKDSHTYKLHATIGEYEQSFEFSEEELADGTTHTGVESKMLTVVSWIKSQINI